MKLFVQQIGARDLQTFLQNASDGGWELVDLLPAQYAADMAGTLVQVLVVLQHENRLTPAPTPKRCPPPPPENTKVWRP